MALRRSERTWWRKRAALSSSIAPSIENVSISRIVPRGKADAMFEHPALKKIHFEAAAAQIEDQSRLDAVAQRPVDGRANQAGFFLAADDFELDAGFAPDALHQLSVIARFARCGGGHGAIGADVILVHAVAELAKSARGARDRFVVEQRGA